MAIRVEPELSNKLEKFGVIGNKECYNCGNCTAVCNLTEKDSLFPRRVIKYIQLGLKDKLEASIEPWLCYYCGDCSTTCPRGAHPGEQMMAVRRYLSSVYDWTGISRSIFTSPLRYGLFLFVIAAIVVGLFVGFHIAYPGRFNNELAITPDGINYVPLNSFAPVKWIHLGDWILFVVLSLLLLSNIFNMWWKIVLKDQSVRVPFYLYFQYFWSPIVHFFTQFRILKCDKRTAFWINHFFLMTAYVSIFTLVVIFLPSFQIDKELFNWTTVLGYYATAGLLYGTTTFIISRIRRKDEMHKHTHFSDWVFLILLFNVALTGILVHIFRLYLKLPMATYVTYVIHLAAGVAFISKVAFEPRWTHLIYRPVAMYFNDVKNAAKALQLVPGARARSMAV